MEGNMKRFARLFFTAVLLAGLLPFGIASAQTEEINCQIVAAGLNAPFQEGELNGAKYCVIYPRGLRWNRDLVVFAHGYVFVDPLDPFKAPEIPWDQAIRGDLNLPGILVNLGYAFAITSYHKDGLAVKEGVQDVVALVDYIKTNNTRVRRVFLTGASEGGLVTTLALEKYPEKFSGGFATCGPIGDFQGQVNYWGDFRALFDVFYPNVLRNPAVLGLPYPASSPIYIDPIVSVGWGTDLAPGPVGQTVGYFVSLDPSAAVALVTAAKAPIDPQNPTSVQATIGGLLTYNVMATNEGRRELANNPFISETDLASTNIGSPYFNSGAVNGIPVEPFTADPAVASEIALNYTTSGKLVRQLVVMHTTGDPIVPFWHSLLYTQKVLAQRNLRKLSLLPINRYGHCNFTPAEAVLGFYTMVIRSTLMPFSAKQIQQALPDKQSQDEFFRLRERYREDIIQPERSIEPAQQEENRWESNRP